MISRFGQISLPSNCNGCVNLTRMPTSDGVAVAGIFGPGRLPPEQNSNQITQSIILSTQIIQAEATLDSANTDPEKDKKKTPDIVVEGQTCQ